MDKYQRMDNCRKWVSYVPFIGRLIDHILYMILDKHSDYCEVHNKYDRINGIIMSNAGYEHGRIWVVYPDGAMKTCFLNEYSIIGVGEEYDNYVFLGYMCENGTIATSPKDWSDILYGVWMKKQESEEEKKDGEDD